MVKYPRLLSRLVSLFFAAGSGAAVVQTDSGPVSGSTSDGVAAYLAIPYAAPPLGGLRWKPPADPLPWSGVRDATRRGPQCPQPGEVPPNGMSEDCLTLNVWTPAATSTARLPVMVFIHGGSWMSGSGALELYDGGTLSRKGVVVVTLNYRLGALGFLAHPDLTTESPHHSSGNYGFLDQAAALGWVKRNIGAFGGDPSRVTAFGESAGANSMLAHLVSPGSKGLLQQAIVESGPLWSDGGTIAVFLPRAWAEQDGVGFAASLGVSGPDTIRGLRATSVADLLAASPSDQGSAFWFMHALRFKPITDGWVIPEDPRILFRRGVATIPLLIGTNADEGTTLAVNAEMSVADYPQFVRDTFGPKAGQVLARYPASTPEEVQHQMERMMTDIDFAAAAKFVAGSSPDSWLYRFSYVTPGFGLGAFHGSELLYIFRSGLMPSDPTSTGVSDTMMDLWTRFARTGDPNGGIGVTWPRYETSADRYLDIGASPTVKSGYGPAPTACKADAKTMCLGPDGRFKVQATYGDYAGNRGDGKARKLSNASGYFSFYDPENIELVVKFLGFCSGGSGDWAFYASGLTDLEFTLDVTDTRTGIHREYLNPLGSRFCTAVDESFPCP